MAGTVPTAFNSYEKNMKQNNDPSDAAPEFDPSSLPADVVELPEPARAAAVDTIQQLLASGSTLSEAIDKARGMAADWINERAPGDQSEVKTVVDAIPDRAEINASEMRITQQIRPSRPPRG